MGVEFKFEAPFTIHILYIRIYTFYTFLTMGTIIENDTIEVLRVCQYCQSPK